MENDDIKIDNSYGNFKYRVNGVLMHNDEVLIVKMKHNSFYCLPGGHVKIGEDSKSAVIREIKEETGYDSHINKLISMTENFFIRKNGEKIHEIGLYYLLNLNDDKNIQKKEYETIENNKEKIKLKFKWVPINELENIDFKPIELKETLEKKDVDFKHLIIK